MNTGTYTACKYNTDSFLETFQNVVNYLYHSHTELGKIDVKIFMTLQEKRKSKKGHDTLEHICCITDNHFSLSYCFNENAENNVILP